MTELSLIQKFYLCTATKKGKIGPHTYSYFTTAALAELTDLGYIADLGNARYVQATAWADGPAYLKPFYDWVGAAKKYRSVGEIVALNKTSHTELYDAVGTSLVELGMAERVEHDGLFGKKIRYVPKTEATRAVVDSLRADVFGPEPIGAKTAPLISLLIASGYIKSFFSAYDKSVLKERVTEVRASDAFALAKSVEQYQAAAAVAASAGAATAS